MFLVPYKRMVITSSQEDNIIINRLKDIVEPNVYWFKHPPKEKEFIGNISSTSFYITRNIMGRNTYLPRLHLRLFKLSNGTNINIVMTLHPAAVIAMLCFTASGLYLSIKYNDYKGCLFILGMMIIFHTVMYFTGFLPEVRWAEKRLREIAA